MSVIFLAIKIIGCLLMAASGLGAGCFFSYRMYSRKSFLSAFQKFLTAMITNIRYNCSDLFTLVSLCSNEIISITPDSAHSFEEWWGAAADRFCAQYSLKKKDRQLLMEFGKELGKTDLDGQINHLELYKSLFEARLAQTEEEINQKSKLYKSLGLFAGLSAALILI